VGVTPTAVVKAFLTLASLEKPSCMLTRLIGSDDVSKRVMGADRFERLAESLRSSWGPPLGSGGNAPT